MTYESFVKLASVNLLTVWVAFVTSLQNLHRPGLEGYSSRLGVDPIKDH